MGGEAATIEDAVAALGGNPDRLRDQGIGAADQALVAQATRTGTDPAIRQTLATEDARWRSRNGRRLLERTLKTHQTSIDAIQPERLQEVLSERNMTNLDQLLEAIGLGNQMAAVIAGVQNEPAEFTDPEPQV